MKKRAEITVYGDVQEAGYRSYIWKTAQGTGPVGFVENLPDGTVHIICEGEEESIDSFLRHIQTKMEFVEVERIEKKFGKATGESGFFEVKIRDVASELFQGFATSRRYFSSLGEKVDRVGDKVDSLGDTLGRKMDSVGQEVRELKEVTIQSFKKLDERYHIIAQNLERLSINIEKMAESLIILVKNHIEREESKG